MYSYNLFIMSKNFENILWNDKLMCLYCSSKKLNEIVKIRPNDSFSNSLCIWHVPFSTLTKLTHNLLPSSPVLHLFFLFYHMITFFFSFIIFALSQPTFIGFSSFSCLSNWIHGISTNKEIFFLLLYARENKTASFMKSGKNFAIFDSLILYVFRVIMDCDYFNISKHPISFCCMLFFSHCCA